MFVVKRDGRKEPVHFDKITSRLRKLAWGLSPEVDPALVTQKVISGVYCGVSTEQLDELAAQTAAHLVTVHPDFGMLAARLEVSNLHKNTKKAFSAVVHDLYHYINPRSGEAGPLISDSVYQIVQSNADQLDAALVYDRDFGYDYFGIKTLTKSYLLKINGRIAERPQHLLMRVALGIHGDDLPAALETYDLLSLKWFTHASPTLFNSGTQRPQLSSCFLLTVKDDSIEGIYDTLKQCAQISKNAGGIGVAIHCIRGTGSYIKGTNGTSNGIVPMLRVFNNTARYVDQGGGKRKGSFAMYLEPWHSDILQFLELRKNHGSEEERARDLFFGLWIPDLFMRRVEEDAMWSLFCPNEAKRLHEVYGAEFEALFTRYESQKKYKRQLKARELWTAILQSQVETGTPFMCYKDAANNKSNQKNLGTIKSSNLCTEIMEFTSPQEVAVCNLASIALPKFVDDKQQTFDFEKLVEITKVVTRNLNKVIDVNFYPVPEAKTSNLRHRPIGIGVQGLADVFMKLRVAFDSDTARELNRKIFEAIYFGALSASSALAEKDGPYETYKGSPLSEGKLQQDLWREFSSEQKADWADSDCFDWATLRANIAAHGVRNSLLVAPMPTASTSQILGNNECFEPYTSNVYVRRTLAGEFVVINNHLLRDLIARGIWTPLLKDKLIAANGSVQGLKEVPSDLKAIYKTVWEISQKTLIDMAAERGRYVDQSMSFNIHMMEPSVGKLTSMHFYGWKKGLKTGMYYLRTKAATDAIKFTVDQEALEKDADAEELHRLKDLNLKAMAKNLDSNEDCVMCGS